MLTVHKIKEYLNSKNETRILVTFARKSNSILGGLGSTVEFGSIVLNKGVTLDQANEALPIGKECSDVKFGAMDESGFYRVVAA